MKCIHNVPERIFDRHKWTAHCNLGSWPGSEINALHARWDLMNVLLEWLLVHVSAPSLLPLIAVLWLVSPMKKKLLTPDTKTWSQLKCTVKPILWPKIWPWHSVLRNTRFWTDTKDQIKFQDKKLLCWSVLFKTSLWPRFWPPMALTFSISTLPVCLNEPI